MLLTSVLNRLVRPLVVSVCCVVAAVCGLSVSLYHCMQLRKVQPQPISFECETNRLMLRKRRALKGAPQLILSKSLTRALRDNPDANDSEAPATSCDVQSRPRSATMFDFCKNVAAASRRLGAQMTPTVPQSARKCFFSQEVEDNTRINGSKCPNSGAVGIEVDDEPNAKSAGARTDLRKRTRAQTISKLTRDINKAFAGCIPTPGAKKADGASSLACKSANTELQNDQQAKGPAARVPALAATFVKLAGAHTHAAVRGSAKSAKIVTKSAVRGTVVSAQAAQSVFTTMAKVTASAPQCQRKASATLAVFEFTESHREDNRPVIGERRHASRKIPRYRRMRRRAFFFF